MIDTTVKKSVASQKRFFVGSEAASAKNIPYPRLLANRLRKVDIAGCPQLTKAKESKNRSFFID